MQSLALLVALTNSCTTNSVCRPVLTATTRIDSRIFVPRATICVTPARERNRIRVHLATENVSCTLTPACNLAQ